MPARTFYLSDDHEEKLKDLEKAEIRKPSQMIQALIVRAHRELKK